MQSSDLRRRVRHVHPLVAATAVEIVMASYNALMHHNEHWRVFKAQFPEATPKELEQIYLNRNWGKGVDEARLQLARMLDPAVAPNITTSDRDTIHEALILDKSLMMGRRNDAYDAARRRML